MFFPPVRVSSFAGQVRQLATLLEMTMKKLLTSILFVASLITQSYAIEIPAEKEPEQINPDVYKFKDWEITQVKDMVIYITNGMAVHGHKFGWVKKAGNCSEDILYLTFSTTHEKNVLDKLKNNRLPIKVTFPEVDGISHVMMAELLSVSDFASMKVVTLSNVLKDPVFDLYMGGLYQIEIEIDSPYKYVFDIPVDNWSLDGYIAAKVKAEEMCEAIVSNKELI